MPASMRARVLHRFLVCSDSLGALRGLLEATSDPVFIGHHERLDRYTLRGVPARRIDVAVTPALGEDAVVEVADKPGQHDGAVRRRLAIRATDGFPGHQLDRLPAGRLLVEATDATVTITAVAATIYWTQTFARLRSDMRDYSPARLVTWHWTRYYRHLDWTEVEALAESFAAAHPELPGLSLAEANRLASRELYELSRQLGWRKLTARDKARAGLANLPSWVQEDYFAALCPRRTPSPSGCGQFTLEAAVGTVPMRPAEEIRTAYGTAVVE